MHIKENKLNKEVITTKTTATKTKTKQKSQQQKKKNNIKNKIRK